ncbi:MAG: peroxiredoxin [Thiobacillus sp. 63-78]|uniref:OsmC family protein n=1 Tax=Thiobacillus sp. 63-78 TaxID=1895859 RepID=UPI000968A01C|nr:OsmC family protein [Thiobacillus sp. 63-78]MBN8764683.1 OsmC family protein [Thiobacillus sp.]MBN8772741.1 OsmC family protein [Thiobacillus sp.]OJZ10487.1 MAG: peroxiredoxin [Thiobacillus sp. 63-78]
MKARVKLIEGVSFVGQSASGHSVVMDGPPDFGGKNLGIRPMEMLLIGMGGCSAADVVHILRKARQQVTDCVADLSAERADTDPKVFTKIHLHFTIAGKALDPKRVEQAVKLSAEKYCSASIMLGKVVEITHDFEVVED